MFADSGATMVPAPVEAARYGVIDNDRQILQHRQWGALPRSLSAADRKDQRNLAALIILSAFTRTRIIGKQGDCDQPPWLELFYKESDSNERLRVNNWIVQRLDDYAVQKTVEL
jgi:hypothetical protein